MSQPVIQLAESHVIARFQTDTVGAVDVSRRTHLTVEEIQDAIREATASFATSVQSKRVLADGSCDAPYITFSLEFWAIDDAPFIVDTTINIGCGEFLKTTSQTTKPKEVEEFCQTLINVVRPRFFQALADAHIEFD